MPARKPIGLRTEAPPLPTPNEIEEKIRQMRKKLGRKAPKPKPLPKAMPEHYPGMPTDLA